MAEAIESDHENDFRDMLGLLRKHKADFLLVGAHALAVHDQPRATGDLDIWVRADPVNGLRVWEALLEFGAPLDAFTPEEWCQPGVGLHIGLPPGRIDILTMISGVSFEEAWPKRVAGTCLGVEVDVIGLEAFIRNKRAAGRDKDLLDLKRLEKDQ
ncbi:MAG: hypothetical protein ACPG4Q_13935 [Phycisphaeraceae bacterium]